MMAYMRADGSGPYANKRGEFRGNMLRGRPGIDDPDELHARWRFVSSYRAGRPRPMDGKTSAQLDADGYAGYYLISDEPLRRGALEVPTPPELTEPEAGTEG